MTFSYQQSHQLAAASASSAGSLNSTGWYGTLTWQRNLWPDLSASAFVQWGTNQILPRQAADQNFDTLVFSLNLSYVGLADRERLRAIQLDPPNLRRPGRHVLALPANLIVIGARKTF